MPGNFRYQFYRWQDERLPFSNLIYATHEVDLVEAGIVCELRLENIEAFYKAFSDEYRGILGESNRHIPSFATGISSKGCGIVRY